MSRFSRLTPVFVSFLFVMGFMLHLTNLGQYAAHGRTHLEYLMSPTVDATLAVWMTGCAALLTFGARSFFAAYEVRGWRKAVYWVMTAYVTLSLPGHFRYLATQDASYFDIFPWWLSAALLPYYALLITYLLTLRPRGVAGERAVLA